MFLLAKTEVRISTKASEAYRILSDMERFGEWFPEVISIISANDMQCNEVGKKYLETVSIPLRGERQIELRVSESIENQRFVTEGDFVPLLPRMEIFIAELSETEILVKWSMFSRNRNKLVQVLILPLAKRIIQQRANIASDRLKQLLEMSDD